MELSLKSILRVAGIEYPKQHEVSDLLLEKRELYPSWLIEELQDISRISKEPMMKKMSSMYGEETIGRPPRSLFDREDAESSVKSAEHIYNLAMRLLSEWRR